MTHSTALLRERCGAGRRGARRARARPGPRRSPAWPPPRAGATRSWPPCPPPPTPSAWPTTSRLPRRRRVELFPAWETLPFERVSPGVETMGRRLRTMWRLRDPERRPAVVVASVRALVQRLGPARRGRRAARRRARASGSTATTSSPGWSAPATGARSRSSTGARSRCGARSSTCSPPPPTCPCASTCGATRSTASPSSPWPTSAPPTDLPEVEIFPCRELLPTDEVRARAAALVGARAVGPRAVGAAGRGPRVRRHGVVAAVAGRGRASSCST